MLRHPISTARPLTATEPPGEKATPIVQGAPDATLRPELLVSAKLLLLVVTPAMFSATAPWLVRSIERAGLVVPTSCVPNTRLGPENVASGPALRPTPPKFTDCGLPAVSSVIIRAAERGNV